MSLMATKTGSRATPKPQQKSASIQTNDVRALPISVSATPEELLKSSQNASKKAAVEVSESKKLQSSKRNGSFDAMINKLNSSSLSEQTSTEVSSAANDIRGSLESSVDQEKKTSEYGSVKDSSVSAKVSDGASSLAKTSGSAKISDRVEYVESGKSSMCRGSTSSDVSDESSCSSFSSSINKPHKANDIRWEAIQAVRARDGNLGLGHFRLLKRLGCGDIGSVYLSELSGTKCYFAMKVMDKGSLASRKKLLRAQTEREILQSLDHPFLPTLYTHFETEKFSCLVMEFCPGGDLHTLRQRQPGKHFPEQAVKYVPSTSVHTT